MQAIGFIDTHYQYSEENMAIRGVNFEVTQGEFVAVIGHNGSGKSTLAKLINALYLPSKGKVVVFDMDTADPAVTFLIRRRAGMVFQNPDNQMVTTIVEEDVAFGPENLGIDAKEIRQRVDDALAEVGMSEKSKASPHNLSGGQKQRVAIAGILAMKPDVIILDEPTAMLDPHGRKDVISTVKRLNKEGITIVLITHFMEEAAMADKVIVMDKGKVVISGKPEEVFEKEDLLQILGLAQPFAYKMSNDLKKNGLPISTCLTEEELVEELCRLLSKN